MRSTTTLGWLPSSPTSMVTGAGRQLKSPLERNPALPLDKWWQWITWLTLTATSLFIMARTSPTLHNQVVLENISPTSPHSLLNKTKTWMMELIKSPPSLIPEAYSTLEWSKTLLHTCALLEKVLLLVTSLRKEQRRLSSTLMRLNLNLLEASITYLCRLKDRV